MEVTYAQLLPKIGLSVDEKMMNAWQKVDKKRIDTAEYKEKSAVKERRKKYKWQRANKADGFVHKEGIQYKSQEFYGDGGKSMPATKGKGRRKTQRKCKKKS
jgi:hypothetical protein